MPFNGNGTFSPPSPQYPAVAGTLIKSADWNAIVSDIAAGLSNCVTRDGQSPATADISMGGYGLTNLLTQAQFANDQTAANTAFVQRALGNMAASVILNSATVLTADYAGKLIRTGGAGYTVTLPATTAVPDGAVLVIQASGTGAITVQAAGADIIDTGPTTPSSISVGLGEELVLVRVGTGAWMASGTANLPNADSFSASIAVNGYKYSPGKLVEQWGQTGSIPSGGNAVVALPIAYTGSILNVQVTPISAVDVRGGAGSYTLSGFTCYNFGPNAAFFSFRVLGKMA